MSAPDDFDLSDGGGRLSALERSVTFNRRAVVLLVALAIVALSAISTLGIVALMQDDIGYATQADVEALHAEHQVLQAEVQAYREALAQTRSILDANQASAIQAQLLGQERSYQRHLRALKQGMTDLSKMLPGSRTWLDIYHEQMDAALLESQQREQVLLQRQSSALLVE